MRKLAAMTAIGLIAASIGAAAQADVLLNYTFTSGTTYDFPDGIDYTASGGFTYDATTNTISNVTYVAQPGAYTFTAATVDSPSVISFTGDCCGDVDTYEFAHSLALGGTDPIIGAAYGFPDGGSPINSVGAVTTGVPEPAAWTLMLVGLGGMGGALRRARREAVGARI